MKYKFLIFIILLSVTVSYGQEMAVTNVKLTVKENEHGNARLIVVPSSYDAYEKKPTKTSGVYGLLVCYDLKGQTKALHQDLTSDFDKKGSKELFLGFSAKKNNVTINKVLFYRRDLMKSSKFPQKSDCFK